MASAERKGNYGKYVGRAEDRIIGRIDRKRSRKETADTASFHRGPFEDEVPESGVYSLRSAVNRVFHSTHPTNPVKDVMDQIEALEDQYFEHIQAEAYGLHEELYPQPVASLIDAGEAKTKKAPGNRQRKAKRKTKERKQARRHKSGEDRMAA